MFSKILCSLRNKQLKKSPMTENKIVQCECNLERGLIEKFFSFVNEEKRKQKAMAEASIKDSLPLE